MPDSVESLVIGYIAGLVTSAVGVVIAIYVYFKGSPGEYPDLIVDFLDFLQPYHNAFPNTFLIGFGLGVSTTVSGGGAAASKRNK